MPHRINTIHIMNFFDHAMTWKAFFNGELKIRKPGTIYFFREFKIQDAYPAPYSRNYKVLLGIAILM